MSARSKPGSSAAEGAAQTTRAGQTAARALERAPKTLMGVSVVVAMHEPPPPTAGLPLFPAERLAEPAQPRSRTAPQAMRRGGGKLREETQEVSLCETLPASESIVAALVDVTEPTQEISLQDLSAAFPGVANDVQAEALRYSSHERSVSSAARAPSGRSKRWVWAAGALPVLLAATFLILEFHPAVGATGQPTPRSVPAATDGVEVSRAPDQPASIAFEPALRKADTRDGLLAKQPDVDDDNETRGYQAAQAVGAEDGAMLRATDRAALARADKLAAQGSALRQRRKLGPARSRYRAALRVYPGHARALYELAQLAIQQHDGKQALELALELAQKEPEQASYSLLLGDAYRIAGKPREARGAWQKAVRQGSALARKRLK